jgi:hypothetical protein
MSTRGYDRLAGCYRLLETLVFGRALERARFRHFDHLRNRKRILLLGDGDGRGLALVCRLAPDAQIDSLDSSAGMLARSAKRLSTGDRERVIFVQADALTHSFPRDTYDAVTTLFFLDGFSAEQVNALVTRLHPALTADALWFHADFALPPTGWAHMRARAWLALMFAFFRWQTGLSIRSLPPSENLLQAAGFHRAAHTSWQNGFLVGTVFARS